MVAVVRFYQFKTFDLDFVGFNDQVFRESSLSQ